MPTRHLFILATSSLLVLAACEQDTTPEVEAHPAATDSPEGTDEPADEPTLELSTIHGDPQVRCHLSGTLEAPSALDCTSDEDLSERLFVVLDALPRESTTALLQTHGDALLLDDHEFEVVNLAAALVDHAEHQAAQDDLMGDGGTAPEALVIVDGDRDFQLLIRLLMGTMQANFAVTVVPRLEADISTLEVSGDDDPGPITVWNPSAVYPIPPLGSSGPETPMFQVVFDDDQIEFMDSREDDQSMAQADSLSDLSEAAASFRDDAPDGVVMVGGQPSTSIARTAEVLEALRTRDGDELFSAFGFFQR